MPKIIKPAVGSFTASNITIDSSGRVIAASSGAGAANMELVIAQKGPASGNYVASPNATKFQAFLASGGGGGGGAGDGPSPQGQAGGAGAYGFFTGAVTGGTTYAYAAGGLGAGGTPSGSGNAGGAGGNSNITNLAVANGGAAGSGGSPNSANNSGPASAGSAPGSTLAPPGLANDIFFNITNMSTAGGRGGSGGSGVVVIYDNRG
tara:strand:- start:3315 stop:3932 length:618 start_codon:yes stop_codon:yes gene_type:complete